MDYNQKYDIFISYRRDGGEYTAKVLCDNLKSMGYRVFFDVETLRNGAFNTKLYNAIDSCTDFILVLSPNALDRCVHEDDWVRREIEYALVQKKNIIPVMLRGFSFPERLPDSIEALRYCNGIEANSEFFDAFLKKLQSFLDTKKPFSTKQTVHKVLPFLLIPVILGCFILGRYFGGTPQNNEDDPSPVQTTDNAAGTTTAPTTEANHDEPSMSTTVPSSDPTEETTQPQTEPPTTAEPKLFASGTWNTGSLEYYVIDDRTAQIVLTDDLLPNGYTISETPGNRVSSWNVILVFDSDTNTMLHINLWGNPDTKELSLDCPYMKKNEIISCTHDITWHREDNSLIFEISFPSAIEWTTQDVKRISMNLGTETENFRDHYEFWPD